MEPNALAFVLRVTATGSRRIHPAAAIRGGNVALGIAPKTTVIHDPQGHLQFLEHHGPEVPPRRHATIA
jgi:hypothetical protein